MQYIVHFSVATSAQKIRICRKGSNRYVLGHLSKYANKAAEDHNRSWFVLNKHWDALGHMGIYEVNLIAWIYFKEKREETSCTCTMILKIRLRN